MVHVLEKEIVVEDFERDPGDVGENGGDEEAGGREVVEEEVEVGSKRDKD